MRRPPELVALTPGTLRRGEARALVARIGAAVEAGLEGVLVREPELGDRELVELARATRETLDRVAPGAGWLGVHDRAHVALAVGADGLHLGFRSLPMAEVRAFAPPELAIGLSTHARDDPAEWEGADYLFHGPVHATPSKAGRLAPIGPEGVERACERAAVPVWAIGGIEPASVAAVLGAGARGVAVLRGVLGAADPGAAARAFRAALERAGAGSR